MGGRTLTVAANNDDMYYYAPAVGAACYNDDTVVVGGILGDACHASFRFLSFPVAGKDAVLVSARLYLHCALAATPSQTVHIQADKAVNPTLALGTCDPRDRTLTTASVDWALPSVGVGDHFYSADLCSVLQEVIDQATFAAGNAVLIAVMGHSGGGDSNGIQVASYEHPTGDPAQLVLTWRSRLGSGMIL